jgi:RNA polymerase sigma factor (sigma-70 family)
VEREIARHLGAHSFAELFVEVLGWDRCEGQQTVEMDGLHFDFRVIAQKRGFRVIECRTHRYTLMNRARLRRLQRCVRKFAHENIVIYASEEPRKQVWQWAIEPPGHKCLTHREHPFFSSSPPSRLVGRLTGMVFAMEEEERVTLADSLDRVRLALDVPADLKLFVRMPWYCEQSDALARAMRGGVPGARDTFIRFHAKLAKWGSRRGQRYFGLDKEDAFHDAMVGLIQAADRFDPNRGQFSTYAFHWMQQSCQRLGLLEAISVHIPPRVYFRFRRVLAQAGRLEARSGPGTSHRVLERLALRARLAPAHFTRIAGSLQVARFGDHKQLWDRATAVPDGLPGPDHKLLSTEFSELVKHAVKALDGPTSRLLKRRFGIEGTRSTLQEIADDLGLSRERVRQLETKAIETLIAKLRLLLPTEYRELLPPSGDSDSDRRTRYDDAPDMRARAKALIAEYPEGISAVELAARLGSSRGHRMLALRHLLSEGSIRQIGRGRSTTFVPCGAAEARKATHPTPDPSLRQGAPQVAVLRIERRTVQRGLFSHAD